MIPIAFIIGLSSWWLPTHREQGLSRVPGVGHRSSICLLRHRQSCHCCRAGRRRCRRRSCHSPRRHPHLDPQGRGWDGWKDHLCCSCRNKPRPWLQEMANVCRHHQRPGDDGRALGQVSTSATGAACSLPCWGWSEPSWGCRWRHQSRGCPAPGSKQQHGRSGSQRWEPGDAG